MLDSHPERMAARRASVATVRPTPRGAGSEHPDEGTTPTRPAFQRTQNAPFTSTGVSRSLPPERTTDVDEGNLVSGFGALLGLESKHHDTPLSSGEPSSSAAPAQSSEVRLSPLRLLDSLPLELNTTVVPEIFTAHH